MPRSELELGISLFIIYGITENEDDFDGLEEMYDNWINEWEYPKIGIPFGETQSAGHDMYLWILQQQI